MTILFLVALILLFVPGQVFLFLFAHSRDNEKKAFSDASTNLIDAFGISLALIAVSGLLTFIFQSRVSSFWIMAIWSLLLIIGAWLIMNRLRNSQNNSESDGLQIVEAVPLLVFAAIVIFRFYQARELIFPAWVDSVHHTMLVQLFLDHGGVPRTFEPYFPVPNIYHFGFHVSAALISFFSGLDPVQVLIYFGQFLNACVALGIYRLSTAIWDGWQRGLIAMLLVGFVFQMPAYYLTWGRYTLLTGILLLVLAMAVVFNILRVGITIGRAARLTILTTGLILTHYFAAIIFILFLICVVLERILSDRAFLRSTDLRWLVISATLAGLFGLPWVINVFQHAAWIHIEVVSPLENADQAYYEGYLEYLWYLLGPARSHFLHISGLVAVFITGWRTKTRPWAFFTLAFILLSLPWGVNLAPFRPDHGVILAFLPASMLLADFLITPLQMQSRPILRWIMSGLLSLFLIGLTSWGIKDTRAILNPATILADRADHQALTWIEAETSVRSIFLINATGWQGASSRGVDGGWWILPITKRQTVLPPAIALMGGAKEYSQKVIKLADQTRDLKTCDPAFWQVVAESGATHLYLHRERGSMQPDAFIGCEGLDLKYKVEDVYIFAIESTFE